jgi:hypothetical protein
MITRVAVSDRRTRTGTELWPSPSGSSEEFFVENGEYVFEVSVEGQDQDLDLFVDDSKILALKSSKDGKYRWLWSPGFIAGSIDLELCLGRRRVFAKRLVISPSKNKLTLSDFELMLTQILSETSSLFALGQTKVSVEAGKDYSTPITKLEFLRANFELLSKCISRIIEEPVSELRSEVEYILPQHYTGSIEGSQVSQAFGQFGAVEYDRQYLPARLPVARTAHHANLYENQCVKTCLGIWSSWLRQVGRSIQSSSNLNEEVASKWSRRAFELGYKLDRMLSNSFFDNVKELPDLMVQPTHIFTSIPHYRKFFDIQRKLNLGIGKSLGDFLGIPISKTYQLYELWCFFRIISALRHSGNKVVQTRVRAAGTDHEGSSILFEVQFEMFLLNFQKRFDEFWQSDDGIGTFSRTMIPDISVKCDTAHGSRAPVIAFDAKYRVDSALNDAISSAHMYRDAIVSEKASSIQRQVVGSYLLTPAIFQHPVKSWKDEPVPRRFFHPSFVGSFKFGIISLHPKMTLDQVSQTLGGIVEGHLRDYRTID